MRSRVTIIVTHTINAQVLNTFDALNLEDFIPEDAAIIANTG